MDTFRNRVPVPGNPTGATLGRSSVQSSFNGRLKLVGAIEELSIHHVAGWAQAEETTEERVSLTVRRRDTGEILARDVADNFRFGLKHLGASDEGHGFFIRFPQPLPEQSLAEVEVVQTHGQAALDKAGYFSNRYEPFMLIAGDIVNNCNLRCPFCLFDYSNTRATQFMDDPTIEAAFRFLPYVGDSGFWLSCRHEPSLHPALMSLIQKVPYELRKKLFFTTNLAKRMPDDYFTWVAGAGLHHINISIESRVPDIFEKMRKGARFHIFKENWDRLVSAVDMQTQPLTLHYVVLAYKSNVRELPSLVSYLLEQGRASYVEVRYTFDYDHIPADFRDGEFLDLDGWLWLRDQLAEYPAGKVVLILPPEIAANTDKLDVELQTRSFVQQGVALSADIRHYLPSRYEARLSWDGNCEIRRYWAHPYERPPIKEPLCTVNVKEIGDPASFFRSLPP